MSLRNVTIVFLVLAASRIAAAQGKAQQRGHDGERAGVDRQANGTAHVEPTVGVSPMEQRQRARLQQQRAAEYGRQLVQQVRAMQQQIAQLQQQHRMAQFRAQQEYGAQLRKQQQVLVATRNYAADPFVTAPYLYRYVANGANRQTNLYGAEALRQAVRNGYAQGYSAGQADKQDHSASNYESTFAYRDANYGYLGRDVDQSDYNFYFRQGLQRGYEDGFTHRSQYGTVSNGTPTVMAALQSRIIALQPVR